VIFILGGFWLHPVSFFITGLVIVAGTQYEYYLLIKNSGVRPQLIPGMIAGASVYILSTLIAAKIIQMKFFLLLIPLIILIIIIELYRKQEKPFDSLAHTFFPVLYTAFPVSLFPFTAYGSQGLNALLPGWTMPFSPEIVVGFFLLLWANDIGAYLVGISAGRHRLMERISPKKSWEGFFGGLIIALLGAWLLSGWLQMISRTGWLIISLIISVAGTYGDLAESMFKRSIGVKDSGTIMPGHGGFLDRFDSAVFSFPLVFLFILLFG